MNCVSVIIPLYNHGSYIEACIDSVARQTHADIEIIIIDDHSLDDSFKRAEAALARWPNRFVRTHLVRNARNKGAHFTLNRGIALASGSVLAFLNSDDLYTDDRLRQLLAAMEGRGCAWAYSRIAPIDGAGAPFWGNAQAHRFCAEPPALQHAYPSPSWAFLQFQVAISTGNLVVTRQLALDVGGFLPLRYCHDWAFALACAWRGEPAFVDEALYCYRFHGDNSFEKLERFASAEVKAVLSAHCVRTQTGQAANSTYPSPHYGSVLYQALAQQLGLEGFIAQIYDTERKRPVLAALLGCQEQFSASTLRAVVRRSCGGWSSFGGARAASSF